MNKISISLYGLFCLAAIGAASAAIAADAIPEVTVEAARSVKQEPTMPGGAKVEVVSVSHRVTYNDLDLTKSADAATLEQRISSAAKSACTELDKLYPIGSSPTQTDACTKSATDKAMARAKAVIAKASEKK